PPFHMAFRSVLMPGLSPKAMQAYVPQIEAIAGGLIDAMLTHDRGDFIDEFAMPLPAQVMCLMLGLPVQEHRLYKGWSDALPAHSKLMFNITGANRDPQKFPDAESFRLDRSLTQVRQHLSFGAGVHFCLGAPIARLEARIAMRLLLERMPDLRLLGNGERIRT